MLDINKTPNDTEMVIALKGRLDTLTAPQLEEELNSATEGASCLVFDFTELEYFKCRTSRAAFSTEDHERKRQHDSKERLRRDPRDF